MQETINKLKIYKYLLSKDSLTKTEFNYVVELSQWANDNGVSCDMIEELENE